MSSNPITTFSGPLSPQEGMKVRSFCLELLSNIEDSKVSAKDETVEKIKLFFRAVALKNRAGFSDFTYLINFLNEGDPELKTIFQRFLDLVDLQKKLPKDKADPKESCWRRIRIMVRSGLFTKTLSETAEDAKKIGLRPIPALPKPQTVVNLYPTLDAVNMLDKYHREAGRWLMTRTRIITFRELCRSIEASCKKLHDSILGWKDYYLLSVEGKSQEWMADIGYRYLPARNMPKGVLSLSHNSAGEDLFKHITTVESNNFIMFDDGAYSGDQLGSYLRGLYDLLSENGKLSTQKNIYFIFGHFPEDKYKQLDYSIFKNLNVNITILSENFVRSCEVHMDQEDLSEQLKMYIKDIASVWRPQLVTEWKKPDFMSTSMFITDGYIDTRLQGRLGELGIEETSSQKLNDQGPITDILPPYKDPSNNAHSL